MILGFHQDFRSRTKISGHSDRVFAQNFEAVLAGIVIWPGDIIFAIVCQEVQKHILRHPQVRDKVRDKVRDSRIYILMKEDPEIIPGNILSYHNGS